MLWMPDFYILSIELIVLNMFIIRLKYNPNKINKHDILLNASYKILNFV